MMRPEAMPAHSLEKNVARIGWEQCPVIIGSSMTGLVVSHALSREGVEHIMIGGKEPDESPRLGESMNEGASIACWRLFSPEFRQHFYTKSHISLLNGRVATMIWLANPDRSLDAVERRLARKKRFKVDDVAPSLIHLDRSRFDRDLYRHTRRSPCCTFIENQNVSLDYDPDSDRIVGIQMGSDGVIRNPAAVFDATGSFGIVARAAGVQRRAISDRQRVVWTHYRREGPAHPTRLWWRHGTNLLRLDNANDHIDAIAWLIPLGNTISVGLSVDAATHPAEAESKESLIQRLDQAFARRGIAYRGPFPLSTSVHDITQEYSVRERAAGANWMLVGRTFIEIWFPSSAGMSTATTAALLATRFLEDPERTGRFYETNLRRLLPFHGHIGAMVQGQAYSEAKQSMRFWLWWLGGVTVRIAYDLKVLRGEPHSNTFEYRTLERLGNVYMRRPFRMLALGAGLAIRARKADRLADLAGTFDDYYQSVRFCLRNYFHGMAELLRGMIDRARAGRSASSLTDDRGR